MQDASASVFALILFALPVIRHIQAKRRANKEPFVKDKFIQKLMVSVNLPNKPPAFLQEACLV